MERENNCDRFNICGNKHILIIPGYYHGDRLCELCLQKRIVKCNKCPKILGYVSCGSTLDKNVYINKPIYCSSCIEKYMNNK